jgi:hypothetical protein
LKVSPIKYKKIGAHHTFQTKKAPSANFASWDCSKI